MEAASPSPWPAGEGPAPALCEEDDRLRVLASFGMDTLDGDNELEDIARFAADLCKAPIALVSVVEEHRQRFLAGLGLDDKETPKEHSFCAFAMLGSDAMVIGDATTDERFAGNPLVTGAPHIRFYAGQPLITSEGAPIGALCIIDTRPRPDGLTPFEARGLRVLAGSVMRRLESARQNAVFLSSSSENEQRLLTMLNSVPDIAWSAGPGPVFDQFNRKWLEMTGAPPPISPDDWRNFIHPDDYDATVSKLSVALEKCAPFQDEWRLRMADGSYRWVLSRALPSGDDPETARWFGTLTDIDEAHRKSEGRALLARELSHRIKNIFAVISGLATLRGRGNPEREQFAAELSETIRALGRANDYVRPLSSEKKDELHELLEVLTAPYGSGSQRRISVSGNSVPLGPSAATPLALIFHELATNAAKYGALSQEGGAVQITVSAEGDDALMVWTESGGPPCAEPEGTGFGTRLLDMSIKSQLEGKVERNWHENGLEVRVTIPQRSLAN